MKIMTSILWVILTCGLVFLGGSAGGEEKIRGFYNVIELRRLLEVARESGFSEAEVRKITIEDNGKLINAWEYLQELEREKRMAEEKLRDDLARRFLTIPDVFERLKEDEEADLNKIRNQLIISE